MGVSEAPIRIGVTGHRSLADTDRILAGIDAALGRVETAFPGRPLVVVSPLAEGADRLIAGRILDRCPAARLIALLPMPTADYELDFTSPESRAEFSQLLGRASCCVELPAAGTRRESYQVAGEAVLDHADILFAAWDGQRRHNRGGTAEIVRIARERGLPIAWIHAGNRKPGTNAPTSLGAEQGRLTCENFERHGRTMPATATVPASELAPALPYRIRIGILAGGSAAVSAEERQILARFLPGALLNLYDPQSKLQLVRARHTPIAYSLIVDPEDAPGRQLADGLSQDLAAWPEGQPAPAGTDRGGHYIVDHCDAFLLIEPAATQSAILAPVLALAARKQRPILRVQLGPRLRVQVQRGCGLNAKSVLRLDVFNGYSPGQPDMERYIGSVYEEIFGTGEGKALPAAIKADIRRELLPYYAKASFLATRSQRWYQRAGSLVWLLFPLAIAAVAVGILIPPWSAAAFATELLLLATIAVVVTQADRQRSLQAWIETRFLAERIRCAAFLAACGCKASTIRVPPYMGGAQERDQWMVLAFNEIWARLPAIRACPSTAYEAIRAFAGKAWVEEQIAYHERKAKECERKGRHLERWGTLMFLLALVAAAIHLALARGVHPAGPLVGALTFAAILLPAVGAAIGGFRSHREFSRLGKRSRYMCQELRQLRERLTEAEDPASIRQALLEMEETVLGEAQDWLMLMRFVPVQYPG
jgi:hypothetical protein